MQKIVVFAGRKQSGKSSACNFLHGHILKKNEQVKFFDIDNNGKLIVNAVYEDDNGGEQEGQGIIDIYRKDYEFSQFAQHHVWPYIKAYNFADRLKETASLVFGIPMELLNGSNEDKDTPTHLKYSDFAFCMYAGEINKLKKDNLYEQYLTVRQVLQFFGTKVCRRIQDSCWIDRCISDIITEQVPFATVGDCRFPNEVQAMQAIGAKVIYLKKKIDNDHDLSESSLDDYTGFDHVIDNQEMTIEQKNIEIFKYLESVGFVEKPII